MPINNKSSIRLFICYLWDKEVGLASFSGGTNLQSNSVRSGKTEWKMAPLRGCPGKSGGSSAQAKSQDKGKIVVRRNKVATTQAQLQAQEVAEFFTAFR